MRKKVGVSPQKRNPFELSALPVIFLLSAPLGRPSPLPSPLPLTVEQVAQPVPRARRSDVRELLETLAALGHVGATDDDAFVT